MFSAFEKAMIRRYLLPGSEGRIVMLVAAIGMSAVAIGVASLIVVMSVMNGARSKLMVQFASIDGHASISRPGEVLPDWRILQARALREPGVLSATPALEGPAMAAAEGRAFPALIRGLRAEDLRKDPIFSTGSAALIGAVPQREEQVVLGAGLAASLGVSTGNRITLMRPQSGTEGDMRLRSVGYTVAGVVETSLRKYDETMVVMTMPAAQAMLDSGDAASRINLTVADAEQAEPVLAPLKAALGGRARIQTWRALNKTMFDALAVEQVGMFVILSMIVLVALFNILASMVMLVRSKIRDIAIMRTMGASRASIMKIFVAVGSAIGSSGAIAGCLLGLGLVAAKDDIAGFLKDHVLGANQSDEMLVLIDLPARIGTLEVAAAVAMALAGTLLATLYPALKASRVDPVTVLRYD